MAKKDQNKEFNLWAERVRKSIKDQAANTLSNGVNQESIVELMSQVLLIADNYLEGAAKNVEDFRRFGKLEGSVACKKGCSFCCHIEVTASAAEVIAISDYISRKFSTEEQTSLQKKILRRNEESQHMSDEVKANSYRPCPFLQNNECLIYSVRPLTCRSHHSLDASLCERDYNGEDVKIPMVDTFASAVEPPNSGYLLALQEAKLVVEPLWFTEAMEVAFSKPDSMTDWCNGENSFESASKSAYERNLWENRESFFSNKRTLNKD